MTQGFREVIGDLEEQLAFTPEAKDTLSDVGRANGVHQWVL
jgi:hypothetical protein